MEQIERPNETLHRPLPTSEWSKLIRKLRWIGLEDEARRLETAVSTLPPEERGSVSAGPFSTD